MTRRKHGKRSKAQSQGQPQAAHLPRERRTDRNLVGSCKPARRRGNAANNPILLAVREARTYFPGDSIKVISIGTGSGGQVMKGAGSRSMNIDNLIQWRPQRLFTNLFDLVMSTQSKMSVELAASEIGDENILRLEPTFVGGAPDLDDSSDKSLKVCLRAGRDLWARERFRVLEFLALGKS